MEKYENLGLVGEGSYGMVMKCRHRETGRIVAVKKFLESDEDKTVKKIALREIRMLKQLHHDNLVNLLEVWKKRRRWYLVFEFVERTVLDELEQHPSGLEPNLTRRYLYQILRAAAFCHLHNVIHRDIKPENILVSQGGVVKLCDFGFARLMAAPGEQGVYTDYVATRWYRAPELLVGDNKYGRPVDVWAVGCLCVEMVTGQPLFPGDSDIDQLYHIMRCFGNLTARHQEVFYRNPVFSGIKLPDMKIRQPLEKHSPKLTGSTLDLTQRCLQMDPERRAQCSELLQHQLFTHDHFHIRFIQELNVKVQRKNSTFPKIPRTPRKEEETEVKEKGRKRGKEESRVKGKADPKPPSKTPGSTAPKVTAHTPTNITPSKTTKALKPSSIDCRQAENTPTTQDPQPISTTTKSYKPSSTFEWTPTPNPAITPTPKDPPEPISTTATSYKPSSTFDWTPTITPTPTPTLKEPPEPISTPTKSFKSNRRQSKNTLTPNNPLTSPSQRSEVDTRAVTTETRLVQNKPCRDAKHSVTPPKGPSNAAPSASENVDALTDRREAGTKAMLGDFKENVAIATAENLSNLPRSSEPARTPDNSPNNALTSDPRREVTNRTTENSRVQQPSPPLPPPLPPPSSSRASQPPTSPPPPPPSHPPGCTPLTAITNGNSLVTDGNLIVGAGPHPGTLSLRCLDNARRLGSVYGRPPQRSLSTHCTGGYNNTQMISERKSVMHERSFLSERERLVTMVKKKPDTRFPELRTPLLPDLRGEGKQLKAVTKDQRKDRRVPSRPSWDTSTHTHHETHTHSHHETQTHTHHETHTHSRPHT